MMVATPACSTLTWSKAIKAISKLSKGKILYMTGEVVQ